MVAAAESLTARAQGLRSSSLKRPLSLYSQGCRLTVDADGSVRSFESLREKRSLFGYEQIWIYKVQAGIVVHAQRPDWGVRATPRSAQLVGRVFENVEVVESLEFHAGDSLGYFRKLRLRNGGHAGIRLRLLEFLDPSAAHFGGPSRWGSLGVNAFNRESHIAMDEVSDPPSARVVGSSPPPAKLFMTNTRSRAQELVSAGELPEATAGMSGQVLILSSHEVELAPGEARDFIFASIYNSGKLEQALSDFSRIQSGERRPSPPIPLVACSDQAINEAASWAVPAIEGSAYADDHLERYEALRGLCYIDPEGAHRVIEESKLALRKDGSIPHSMEPSKPGVLETAVLLRAVSLHLALHQDRRLVRAAYPLVKKLAGCLLASSKEYHVETDPSLPQGWRRHLGRGYPTGEIPEVSLAVAGGLEAASRVAKMASKADDAGKFKERSEMLSEQVRKRLIDDRGFIALCRDSTGRLRSDDTIDMAVAAYRHPFLRSAEQAAAHRMLERDCDTKYGPRCVPTTNQVYFNPSYGEGELGGVWPRAVLAHAMVCYRSGLAGLGSLGLAKVARLVADDAPKLGSSPGAFPRWVNVDGEEAHGDETDPVAAARLMEVLLEGELGLQEGPERPSLAPASGSGLRWVMVSDIWAGEAASVFLGRGGDRPQLFVSGGKFEVKSGARFAKCERLDLPARGVYGIAFNTPGQVICIGNGSSSQARATVTFAPRAAELSRRLTTPLESYDASRGVWVKMGSLRVSPTMTFEAAIDAGDWRAFRVSTP